MSWSWGGKSNGGADPGYSSKEAARAQSISATALLGVALSCGWYLFTHGGTGTVFKFSYTKAEGWVFDFSASGIQILLAVAILVCLGQAKASFDSARSHRTRSVALEGRLDHLDPREALQLFELGPPPFEAAASKPEEMPARSRQLPLPYPRRVPTEAS